MCVTFILMLVFSISSGEEAERKFQFPSSFKQPDNTIPYVVRTGVGMSRL